MFEDNCIVIVFLTYYVTYVNWGDVCGQRYGYCYWQCVGGMLSGLWSPRSCFVVNYLVIVIRCLWFDLIKYKKMCLSLIFFVI